MRPRRLRDKSGTRRTACRIIQFAKSSINQPQDIIVRCGFCVSCHPINRTTDQPTRCGTDNFARSLSAAIASLSRKRALLGKLSAAPSGQFRTWSDGRMFCCSDGNSRQRFSITQVNRAFLSSVCSICQELDQSAARHYRQVRLLCELPSDQQDNRPAEHVRNWQFWDREGAAPNGGVRVVE